MGTSGIPLTLSWSIVLFTLDLAVSLLDISLVYFALVILYNFARLPCYFTLALVFTIIILFLIRSCYFVFALSHYLAFASLSP
jgi:hypothetical protein